MTLKITAMTVERKKYLAAVQLLDVFHYGDKPGDHLYGGTQSCFKAHNDALDREDYGEALIQARKCEDIGDNWKTEERAREDAQSELD